jgi:predicted nucleotidyltransferase
MPENIVTDQNLQEVIHRLVSNFQPERIYLFGSYARGSEVAGQSDIDILVIIRESDLPRHQREAQFYDSLWGLPTPVEMIVLTRREFDQAKEVKTSLSATAVNQGVVICDVLCRLKPTASQATHSPAGHVTA